jgi:uncharacterized protein (DUF2062 family)
MRAFFYEQLFPNIIPFLKQGISPTKLASGFSLGTVIGTMPMFFVATPLCAILAYFFGINQVIVQIANHSIGYPLQILLFYPFTAVGSLIIFREHRLNHEAVTLLFTSGFHCITSELGIFIAQALTGWLLLAPLIFLLLFVPSYFIFQRLKLPVNTK